MASSSRWPRQRAPTSWRRFKKVPLSVSHVPVVAVLGRTEMFMFYRKATSEHRGRTNSTASKASHLHRYDLGTNKYHSLNAWLDLEKLWYHMRWEINLYAGPKQTADSCFFLNTINLTGRQCSETKTGVMLSALNGARQEPFQRPRIRKRGLTAPSTSGILIFKVQGERKDELFKV